MFCRRIYASTRSSVLRISCETALFYRITLIYRHFYEFCEFDNINFKKQKIRNTFIPDFIHILRYFLVTFKNYAKL